jgi:hypothetical protein
MRLRKRALAIAVFLGITSAATPALAVPSYSRQTGEPCTSCHVGAYGPALTPHGRAFKLGGYSDGKTVIPLSVTALASFTHTAKNQAEPASEHDGRNDNVALQEVVGFIAGRIAPHLGTFIGVAYEEPDRHALLDHFDVRYAQPLKLGGKDAILGFDVNNAPGSQDPFNTLPVWAFPHEAPELVPERLGSPLLADGLEGQVAGLSTYLWFNDSLYAEIAGYRSLGHGLLNTIGVEDEAGKISGVAPYARLAYQKDWGKSVAAVGVVAMRTKLHPEREPGPTNKYFDWGLDATYQYLGNRKNIIDATLGYVHERQTLDFDFEEGATARRHHNLSSVNASVGWSHLATYGLTVGLFDSWGTRDADLFAPEEDGGSRTGKPNTAGYILQADWTPFGKEGSWGAPAVNLRLGLQYTGYFKFNGASDNYDGFGRDASDNNSVFAFAAVAF